MHAWIFQLSEERIEGYLCEDTLLQGDGSDYDYCAAISEEARKRAVYSLMAHILPLGMFRLKDETTLVYQGGFGQRKREWVERIQTKVAKMCIRDRVSTQLQRVVPKHSCHSGANNCPVRLQ